MRPLRDLPDSLRGSAFQVATARALGVTRGRLEGTDLHAPFHGVRAPIGRGRDDDVLHRCFEYAPRLQPWQFLSHETAAIAWGFPLRAAMLNDRLHVSAMSPHREPRTAGVIGHRLDLPSDAVVRHHGLPLASPSETWAQLGAGHSVDDLVATGDFVAGRGRLASVEDLAAAVGRVRREGAERLREALELIRPRAESPQESRLRLAMGRANLPEPEVNWTLRDANGGFIARLDLAFPRYRVCTEYDGRQHAEATQFARDADRWYAIERQGWIIVRVLNHHLREGAHVAIARTWAALASRGWAP